MYSNLEDVKGDWRGNITPASGSGLYVCVTETNWRDRVDSCAPQGQFPEVAVCGSTLPIWCRSQCASRSSSALRPSLAITGVVWPFRWFSWHNTSSWFNLIYCGVCKVSLNFSIQFSTLNTFLVLNSINIVVLNLADRSNAGNGHQNYPIKILPAINIALLSSGKALPSQWSWPSTTSRASSYLSHKCLRTIHNLPENSQLHCHLRLASLSVHMLYCNHHYRVALQALVS